MAIDAVSTYFDSRVSVFLLANTASTNTDISANITNCEFPDSWKNNVITTYGSVGERYGPSINDTKFTLEMVWNQLTTTGTDVVVQPMHYAKSLKAFAYYPAGTTAGNLKISGNCYCPTYRFMGRVGNYVAIRAEFEVDNGTTFGAAT
jgi:hypothetical protein